jgi:hypothetical protein
VQTTKFKEVLNFLSSNLDIDGHGTTEKVQRHTFSRHNGAHYNAAAALANGRTSEFLKQQLL